MKYENLIQEAKNKINEGFDKIGRKIDNPTNLERYLVAATIKAVNITNAIIVLCKNNFTDESLILLRSLIEHSVNMHWIMDRNTEERFDEFWSELLETNSGFWAQRRFDGRMEDIGFEDKEYYDSVVKITYTYSHVSASSLNWDLVIDNVPKKEFSAEAIYSVVAQMLGHVLKSLDMNFKGLFDYNSIWKQIKVDRTKIREKLKKIIKELEDIKNNQNNNRLS